jgi:hypothetical protein
MGFAPAILFEPLVESARIQGRIPRLAGSEADPSLRLQQTGGVKKEPAVEVKGLPRIRLLKCSQDRRGSPSALWMSDPKQRRERWHMSTSAKRNKTAETVASINIPEGEWGGYLETFSSRHHGWLVQLETYDTMTREQVVSREMPLQSIELDLEDEKNPRINVTVQFDNKVIKHILFLPSQLVLKSSDDKREQSLQVETVNTETTVRFRAPVPP